MDLQVVEDFPGMSGQYREKHLGGQPYVHLQCACYATSTQVKAVGALSTQGIGLYEKCEVRGLRGLMSCCSGTRLRTATKSS